MPRIYYRKEIKAKQSALLEYYKYHKDIPRFFMKPSYHTIYRFHEKKRRIEYGKIKRQLGIQDEVKEETDVVDEKKQRLKTSQDCSVRQLKNLLQGVNLEESSYLQIKQTNPLQLSQSISQLKDLISLINNEPQQQIKTQNSNKHKNLIINSISKQQNFQKSVEASEQIQKLLLQQKSQFGKQIETANFKKIELPIKLAEDLRRSKQSTAPKLRSQKIEGFQSTLAFSQSIEQQLTHRSKQEIKGRQGSSSNFNLNEIERLLQTKESQRRPDQRSSLHNAAQNLQKSKGHVKQLSLGQNTFQQQLQTLKNLYKQSSQVFVKDQRTKSSDQLVSPATRPNSSEKNQEKKQQMKISNNVYVQGSKKQPQIYTINQNNVVNIYLDDIKNSFKSVSLTSRGGSSPQKFGTRKIFNCNEQSKNVSPFVSLKKM